jgi:hypothetical protein
VAHAALAISETRRRAARRGYVMLPGMKQRMVTPI